MSEHNRYFDDPEISRILTKIMDEEEPDAGHESDYGPGSKPGASPSMDPVKLYLRDMGSVLLLSQTEEIGLAKKNGERRKPHDQRPLQDFPHPGRGSAAGGGHQKESRCLTPPLREQRG